jgi:hypothetical protein
MDERGWKPPAEEAAAAERRRQGEIVRQVLNLETEGLVIGALGLLDINEDSPEWNAARIAWREYQKGRTF